MNYVKSSSKIIFDISLTIKARELSEGQVPASFVSDSKIVLFLFIFFRHLSTAVKKKYRNTAVINYFNRASNVHEARKKSAESRFSF